MPWGRRLHAELYRKAQSCTERHRAKSQALPCFEYTTPLSQEFTVAIRHISGEQICTLVYALGVSWFIKLMIGDPQPSKQLTNNLFSYTLPLPVQSDKVWGLQRPRLRKLEFNSHLTSFTHTCYLISLDWYLPSDCDL